MFVILLILGFLASLIVWNVQWVNEQSENSLCSLSGYTTDAIRNIVGAPQGFATCAVVGSANFLRKQRLGVQIDSHDFVIRANLAPVSGYEEIVGSKTSLRIMNTQALDVAFRHAWLSALFRWHPAQACAMPRGGVSCAVRVLGNRFPCAVSP